MKPCLYMKPCSGSSLAHLTATSANNATSSEFTSTLHVANRRILLKGGQVHAGPAGIYRPNVTIATNPADGTRATLQCDATTTGPCIILGDGDMDGAGQQQPLLRRAALLGLTHATWHGG
jgi:hypothetical protein